MFWSKKKEEPKITQLNSDEYLKLNTKIAEVITDLDTLSHRFELVAADVKALQIKTREKRLRDVEANLADTTKDGKLYLGDGGRTK